MIAQELEVSLHRAFVDARQERHEFIGVEHLLLSLLDNPSARKALEACGANAKKLRSELTQHIARTMQCVPENRDVDTQPTLAFQRVIQRAILHVQAAGRTEVSGADVLVAILGEKDEQRKDSPRAVDLLARQGVTRLDVVRYMSHGITKAPTPVQDLETSPSGADPATLAALDEHVEAALHSARARACEMRHEYMTVEHLLLAILDAADVDPLLRGCGADMDGFRNDLARHIVQQTPLVAAESKAEPQPTLGFQRVIQRAALHVQSTAREKVTPRDMLVAVFGEHDSHAVYFLQKHGVTRADVINRLASGVTASGDVPADVQVVLYRDDDTPMEFFVRVLREVFAMDQLEAAEALVEIYRDGQAVCGLYSAGGGATTVEQVLAFARQHGHPLRCATVVPKQP